MPDHINNFAPGDPRHNPPERANGMAPRRSDEAVQAAAEAPAPRALASLDVVYETIRVLASTISWRKPLSPMMERRIEDARHVLEAIRLERECESRSLEVVHRTIDTLAGNIRRRCLMSPFMEREVKDAHRVLDQIRRGQIATDVARVAEMLTTKRATVAVNEEEVAIATDAIHESLASGALGDDALRTIARAVIESINKHRLTSRS